MGQNCASSPISARQLASNSIARHNENRRPHGRELNCATFPAPLWPAAPCRPSNDRAQSWAAHVGPARGAAGLRAANICDSLTSYFILDGGRLVQGAPLAPLPAGLIAWRRETNMSRPSGRPSEEARAAAANWQLESAGSSPEARLSAAASHLAPRANQFEAAAAAARAAPGEEAKQISPSCRPIDLTHARRAAMNYDAPFRAPFGARECPARLFIQRRPRREAGASQR